MADNVVLSTPVGTGDTIAADDVSGVKYQLVQLVTGADGGAKSLVTGSTGIPVTDAGGSLTVDGTVSISGTVTVDSELPAAAALADNLGNPTTPLLGGCLCLFDGTQWLRARGDTTNGLDVDVTRLPALATGSNVIGQVGLEPRTSGGLSCDRTISAASTNAKSIKASAGQVYGWYLSNTNSSPRYVKLYNKASAPTVGTDAAFMTIMVPGSGGANVEFSMGIALGTGIALAITTGAADSDTGAVAANEVIVHVLYK